MEGYTRRAIEMFLRLKMCKVSIDEPLVKMAILKGLPRADFIATINLLLGQATRFGQPSNTLDTSGPQFQLLHLHPYLAIEISLPNVAIHLPALANIVGVNIGILTAQVASNVRFGILWAT